MTAPAVQKMFGLKAVQFASASVPSAQSPWVNGFGIVSVVAKLVCREAQRLDHVPGDRRFGGLTGHVFEDQADQGDALAERVGERQPAHFDLLQDRRRRERLGDAADP